MNSLPSLFIGTLVGVESKWPEAANTAGRIPKNKPRAQRSTKRPIKTKTDEITRLKERFGINKNIFD